MKTTSGRCTPARIAARFDLVTSTAQLGELRRVSRHPKLKTLLPAHRVGAMVNNMQRAMAPGVLPPLPDGMEANDPSDGFLLAMALASEADYLVTGDRRAGLLQRGAAARTQPGSGPLSWGWNSLTCWLWSWRSRQRTSTRA